MRCQPFAQFSLSSRTADDDILLHESFHRMFHPGRRSASDGSMTADLGSRALTTSALGIMAQQRQFAWPTYLVGFSLFLLPLFDAISQFIPFRPQDAKWRFGAFGIFSNSLLLSLLGIA